MAKTNSGARVGELVKVAYFDDDHRIGFALKSVIIGEDEHGEPITAPVVIADETQALMTPRNKPMKVVAA